MKPDFTSPYIIHDHLVTDVARIYSNEYKVPFSVMVGDFSDYDLASFDGEMRVEVKFESTPLRTGKVAIEFWNTELNKPSGILGTTANIWLHLVQLETEIIAYEYDIEALRRLAIEQGEVKQGGRNALCKIISLESIRSNANRQFPVSP